jgi:hypothetical protein
MLKLKKRCRASLRLQLSPKLSNQLGERSVELAPLAGQALPLGCCLVTLRPITTELSPERSSPERDYSRSIHIHSDSLLRLLKSPKGAEGALGDPCDKFDPKPHLTGIYLESDELTGGKGFAAPYLREQMRRRVRCICPDHPLEST